jgi:NAD(P)-dependent dehydrogenase (short-subunit alcohol dehydrogenase family)
MTTQTRKIALITGASRGLGRSMAIALARRGVDVIGTYNSNRTEAEATAAAVAEAGGRSAFFQLDAGRAQDFPAFAATVAQALETRFGAKQFDHLVNNAGVGLHKPFAETTEADFDRLMNIHFKGVFFLTQALLPLLADGGRIVNISSGLARFSPPGYSAYASMKGGVEVLTRYLARELGPRRIAVNTVAPGAIETDFGGGATRDNPQVNAFVASVTALGRAGLPEDIGPAVAALLGDENGWITGQRIEISGGMFV